MVRRFYLGPCSLKYANKSLKTLARNTTTPPRLLAFYVAFMHLREGRRPRHCWATGVKNAIFDADSCTLYMHVLFGEG